MRLDDLCTPVLVKEVRQALRGRSFALGFSTALGLAIVVASVSYFDLSGSSAAEVVLPTYFVLATALLVFVPFHAHQSMRQEDEESARDLLALSPLGPWRIVLGKLAAALVLAGLLLAAFLPFVIVVAWQPAVDTFGVLALLAHVIGVTVFVTALGVASGAARANRFVKAAGVVVLSFVSLGMLAFELRVAEDVLRGRQWSSVAGLVVGGWLGLGAFAPLLLGFAAAGLARDDREVSRGLRIAWLVFAGAMALVIGVAMPRLGAPVDAIVMCAVVAILAGTLVAASLVTEDERLDVESRRRLGRVRVRSLRAACGLLAVGGGRGAALTLVLGLLVAGSALLGVMSRPAGASVGLSGSAPFTFASAASNGVLFDCALVLATAIGVSFAFSALPAHVLGRPKSAPGRRRVARWAAVISLVCLSVLLPLLLRVTSRGYFDEDALFFSPLFVLMEAADGIDRSHAPDGEVFLWFSVGLVAFCSALPSIARGVREALDCAPTRDADDH